MGQVQLIKQILYNFCEAFGQKVSFQKSHVFFSGNVQEWDAENLSQALGIQLTEDLGRYLGVPMIYQWVSVSSYKFVLDKMRKKLFGWKAHSLSFTGRVTLAQASLESILGYILQSAPIPAGVCDEAEKLCQDLLWGTTASTRKCHLIGWDKI